MSEQIIYEARPSPRDHAWRQMSHENGRNRVVQQKIQVKLWAREEQILAEDEKRSE